MTSRILYTILKLFQVIIPGTIFQALQKEPNGRTSHVAFFKFPAINGNDLCLIKLFNHGHPKESTDHYALPDAGRRKEFHPLYGKSIWGHPELPLHQGRWRNDHACGTDDR